MAYSRPSVISIAGLDPSGGAGLLADIKTFEQHRCLGFGIASAITAQTENRFFNINWLSFDDIRKQSAPLLEQYTVDVVKIGIMENMDFLLQLVTWLKSKQDSIRIVWDPVITASSGFHFMIGSFKDKLPELLKLMHLVTPNTKEAMQLTDVESAQDAALWMAQYCPVLLKGGHATTEKGVDYLFYNQEKTALIPTQRDLPAKHGSGCILSSAIAAQLALGASLKDACINAKAYIETILNSNPQLLAYHHV